MARRVVLLNLGSRGDVQPFIALGRGLQRAGWEVVVATDPAFRSLVTRYGLAFRPVGDGSVMTLMRRLGKQGWLDGLRAPLGFLVHLAQAAPRLYRAVGRDVLAALREADAAVFGVLLLPAHYLAERLGVPHAVAALQPVTPSREYAPILWPWDLGSRAQPLNPVGHRALYEALWQVGRPLVGRVLQESGFHIPLPPFGALEALFRDPGLPFLYALSPTVFPRPRDWPAWHHLTGFWLLEEQAREPLPPGVEAFLQAGPPPVYIGFGSMSHRDPHGWAQRVLQALRRLGVRAILARGWAGLEADRLPPEVLLVDEVPHLALFPRVRAVVHHGGIGTVAAALWAGVPQVVVPHFADQPFWAARLHRLGVAPPPLPPGRLTPERLAEALAQALEDPTLRERAARLQRRIRREEGVARAVRLLDDWFTAKIPGGWPLPLGAARSPGSRLARTPGA